MVEKEIEEQRNRLVEERRPAMDSEGEYTRVINAIDKVLGRDRSPMILNFSDLSGESELGGIGTRVEHELEKESEEERNKESDDGEDPHAGESDDGESDDGESDDGADPHAGDGGGE